MSEKEKQIIKEISHLAEKYHANKIVLFGSRARRTHQEKSDIDLAVYGCEEFDIINMDDSHLSRELIREIDRDGVVIYEKVW